MPEGFFDKIRTKLKLVGALLWIAFLATPAFAAPSGKWDCDGKFGLCRYVNPATKQVLIEGPFERGMPFSEGLAAVRIGGRFGYIDEHGKIVIKPQFDLAGEFAHGLAEILVGRKTGVIDRKGEVVVSPMFKRAIPLTSEVIVAAEGTWQSGYYDGFEKLAGFSEVAFSLDNAGLYHVTGYWIRKPNLKRVGAFDKEGRGLLWAVERNADSSRDLYGLLASNGEWVVQPQYDYAAALTDGRAIVRKRVDGVELSGAVDATGQVVIPLRSWTLFYWMNGWGIAREGAEGSKLALVDTQGGIIGGRYFDKVERSEKGDIAKVLIDGHWVGIDRAGNIVPNPDNGRVIGGCPSGVRAVEIDGKVQIADESGQPTSSYLFEKLGFRLACDKPSSVQFNGLWGFVGVDGHLLIDPPSFKNQYGFSDGYAGVSDGQKWGVIDTSGHIVLPVTFDNYLGRRGELFHVAVAGREIWMTATGEERPEPPIKRAPPSGLLDCGHGLRLTEHDGLWGITDAGGTDMIAPRYRALHCFKNGIAWAAIGSQRQWCALGPDGVVQDKPACRATHYPYHASHSSPEKFDEDPFESSVLWSRAYLQHAAGQREAPPEWVGSRPILIQKKEGNLPSPK